jgi:hypothetical protein
MAIMRTLTIAHLLWVAYLLLLLFLGAQEISPLVLGWVGMEGTPPSDWAIYYLPE